MTVTNLRLQAVRHATMLMEINGKTILVDPMLSDKEAIPASKLTANNKMNIPLMELAVPKETLMNADAVLLTHYHFDHFDLVAETELPKDKPIFCQPADKGKLRKLNFTNVIPVDSRLQWEGINFHRVDGNHGRGATKKLMGKSSGFILKYGSNESTFIGGDAVYDELFEKSLETYQPDNIILFGGEARLICGSPITMGSEDIINVCRHSPEARIVVVHMEALNHCGLSRKDLRDTLAAHDLLNRVTVPEDGEIIHL